MGSSTNERWRTLADSGYGDGIIRDSAGDSWVVFRIENPKLRPFTKYSVFVKQDGGKHTDVRVEY